MRTLCLLIVKEIIKTIRPQTKKDRQFRLANLQHKKERLQNLRAVDLPKDKLIAPKKEYILYFDKPKYKANKLYRCTNNERSETIKQILRTRVKKHKKQDKRKDTARKIKRVIIFFGEN